MKTHFQTLYKYNHWCNQQMITLIKAQPDAYSKRAQTLLSHTLNTHHLWNSRLQRVESRYGVWDMHALTDLETIDIDNFESSQYILERFDYEYLLNYTNTLSENHTSRVKDIIFHVINHSTYHRGQLMSALKTQGIAPIELDFSYYKGL